jgi:hypothetical protein
LVDDADEELVVPLRQLTRDDVLDADQSRLDLGAPHLDRRSVRLKKIAARQTWGRCYDHNFQRFSPIFGKKNGVFLKNQCYD